jgi:enoyl-CoA hydratase/carnithine racemase
VHNSINFSKPSIAAINGIAVGAGMAMALLCDITIMSTEAKLNDGHVRIGVAAGDHACVIWPLLCGMAKAKLYALTGRFIEATEAERIGLVSMVVSPDQLMAKALEVADGLAVRRGRRRKGEVFANSHSLACIERASACDPQHQERAEPVAASGGHHLLRLLVRPGDDRLYPP